ncbi:cyclic nucleotide-binding domain-containing protein [Spirosoma taeanense]|nr:cyclic nucleotide-binding domain-containing protein [Spirosoma taeanense]
MTSAQVWYRSIGVRTTEASTVWLFFLHNFFLGIGTILVYVSANVILLENNPRTSLPIAYLTAALAMMGVGKLYTYFEHHLLLRRLAVRVLLAVVVCTFVLGLLVLFGHSIASAIAIMAGYRVIYLLTNLEFWGISAVVFDVRQSKRLFSVISSGDMPAKALGALLSVIVHDHDDLYLLLLTAFLAYGVAMYVLRFTIRSHAIGVAPAKARLRRRTSPPFVRQLFGGHELVFSMCLSLAAIACVVTSVEYFFFINVKQKFHHQGDVMQYIGFVLMLTYLSALIFKLMLSRKTFERIGVRWSLAVLPVSALLGIGLFGALLALGVSETSLLVYFCGLYLLLEVLRRSVFDPIFLVLFQPLTPQARLQGHTLVKGFYEPAGMALAGLLLLILNSLPTVAYWVPFIWMALFMAAALYFLYRTYHHYLNTLKDALERRFLASDDLILPVAAQDVLAENLHSSRPEEVLHALDWFQQHDPDSLNAQASYLLRHTDSQVRARALAILGEQADRQLLHALLTADPEARLRQTAAYWLAYRPDGGEDELNRLLKHSDLAVRTGAIRGRLEANPSDPLAYQYLTELATTDEPTDRIAALELLTFFVPKAQRQLLETALASQDVSLREAAVEAAGQMASADVTPKIVALLTDPLLWRVAARSLIHSGTAAVPYLRAAVQSTASPLFIRRLAGVCGQIAASESRQLLIELTQVTNLFWRAAALRSLHGFAPEPADAAHFQDLLAEEWQLAQRLLIGIDVESDVALIDSLAYELTLLEQRVFGLLRQLYDPHLIADAQRGVAHATRDRKANALEMLENLIPRATYQSLQALVDDLPVGDKLRMLGKLTAPLQDTEPITAYIIQQGEAVFTEWTISQALRLWMPSRSTIHYLTPFLNTDSELIRETASDALQRLSSSHPGLLASQSYPDQILMKHTTTAQISAIDRVIALKRTALFADTPENVLSSIAVIMHEVTYYEGQEVFAKGETGTSLFIIYDGEVAIYDESEQLATFRKGGFFGELALLDAEPRSATAVALTHVMAFRIDQDDFYDLMEERSEVLQNIIRVLCQRLRRQNESLRTLSASVPTAP